MRLEDYLRGIRECSDTVGDFNGSPVPTLTLRWGITDNVLIYCAADLTTVLDRLAHPTESTDLQRSYAYTRTHRVVGRGKSFEFSAAPGTVSVAVRLQYSPACNICFHTCERKDALEARGLLPNIIIYVQPREGGVPGTQLLRVIADVVADLCSLLMECSTHICLPFGVGLHHPNDLSRIPYYPELLKISHEGL